MNEATRWWSSIWPTDDPKIHLQLPLPEIFKINLKVDVSFNVGRHMIELPTHN